MNIEKIKLHYIKNILFSRIFELISIYNNYDTLQFE